MKQEKSIAGHLSAFLTIFIWGTTFISTKLLLKSFIPIEILFFRFILGYIILLFVYPHQLKLLERKQEWIFACAGLCGITLYYLLENIALTYSLASNVGVIISIAPFFTAIFAHCFLEGEKLRTNFFAGFIAAISGILLISYSGTTVLKLNPTGDLLAVLAAIVWAAYSILTKKISSYGYNTIAVTRHTFFYGLLFMIPSLFIFDFHIGIKRFTSPINLFNILFLGLAASALCFVTWNLAVKLLGAVKTSIYIYMVPVITVITSVIILHEKIVLTAAIGIILTLFGLFISERK
jgi:drug/metabolite transporter (DMT)-like permease